MSSLSPLIDNHNANQVRMVGAKSIVIERTDHPLGLRPPLAYSSDRLPGNRNGTAVDDISTVVKIVIYFEFTAPV